MSNHTFAAGTLVRLQSGGPTMTVRSVSGGQAYCVWSVGGQQRQGTFDLRSLVLAQGDGQRPQQPATGRT